MRSVRSLLVMGNNKLGEAIHHFDLPAIVTCPGRTSVCEQVCYATRGRFRMGPAARRLAWNLRQSRKPGFAARLTREIRRKGVLVIRIHVSGDFYSTEYAEKWLTVMRNCPQVRFYFYSRSWRVPEIVPVLQQMALLRCCRAWYSIDDETGPPGEVPPRVRLAYIQTSPDGRPARANLVFRLRRLRKQPRIGLPVVCPEETPAGHARNTNCGNCGYCWR